MGGKDEAIENGRPPTGPNLHSRGKAVGARAPAPDASRARRGPTLRLCGSAHSQRGPDPGRRAVALLGAHAARGKAGCWGSEEESGGSRTRKWWLRRRSRWRRSATSAMRTRHPAGWGPADRQLPVGLTWGAGVAVSLSTSANTQSDGGGGGSSG